jgi:hypothetical protein
MTLGLKGRLISLCSAALYSVSLSMSLSLLFIYTRRPPPASAHFAKPWQCGVRSSEHPGFTPDACLCPA